MKYIVFIFVLFLTISCQKKEHKNKLLQAPIVVTDKWILSTGYWQYEITDKNGDRSLFVGKYNEYKMYDTIVKH